MLTLHRDIGSNWREGDDDLPEHIIWIDLLDPTDEETALVQSRAKIRIPSKEALSEIEASSRLISEQGILYLSTPIVANDDLLHTNLSPVGFILGPKLLVTIRYTDLKTFDAVASSLEADETIASSASVFLALLEAIVDRGADVLEHLGAAIDKNSKAVFHCKVASQEQPKRAASRLRETLTDIGGLGDRLAQARDVLQGIGRIAGFASDVGHECIGADHQSRLAAINKDIVSLNDYDAHLSNKIQFLLDAVLGYISIEQNDLFKFLTIVSVVGVPPTLLAGIWGMNFKNMPELNWTFGYPLAWVTIILSAAVPLLWFRRKGWF